MRAAGALAVALVVFAAAGAAVPAAAYPELFAARHATDSCTYHPSVALSYGKHARITADRSSSVYVYGGRRAVSVLCPGGQYDVRVAFGAPRLALLTTSLGTLAGATDATCPNREVTPAQEPVATHATVLTVACAAAGRSLELQVTSAASRSSNLRFLRVELPVDAAGSARCLQVSQACAPVRPATLRATDAATTEAPTADMQQQVPPVTVRSIGSSRTGSSSSSQPGAFIPLTPSMTAMTGGGADSLAGGGSALRGPDGSEYAWGPILQGNNGLWQALHSLLMLLGFCLLMPLGTLLARHKWLFGRDDGTGKAFAAWGPVHVLCQVLGLASAAGGVVIALLAFGWRTSGPEGQPLYAPHKWMGVGVMGMSLVQLVLGALRPTNHTRVRGCWNPLHRGLGRLTVMAGMANCVLGALLVHDFKGDSYMYWLLPACLLVGAAGLAALVLEAFKVQMSRTHRYNHHTRQMLPVLEGHKRSKRRAPGVASNNGYAGAASPEPDAASYISPRQHYQQQLQQQHLERYQQHAAVVSPAPRGVTPPPGDGAAVVVAAVRGGASPGPLDTQLPAYDRSGRPVHYPLISHRATAAPIKEGFEPPPPPRQF